MNKGSSGGPPHTEEEKKPDDEIMRAQFAGEEEVTLFDKIVKKEIPANIIYEDAMVSSLHTQGIYYIGPRIQRYETSGTLALLGYPKEQDGTNWDQEGDPRSCWTPWPPAVRGESCCLEGPTSHRWL